MVKLKNHHEMENVVWCYQLVEINKYISTNIQLSVQKIITASIRVLHLLSAQSLQMILQICIVYPISDEQ